MKIMVLNLIGKPGTKLAVMNSGNPPHLKESNA